MYKGGRIILRGSAISRVTRSAGKVRVFFALLLALSTNRTYLISTPSVMNVQLRVLSVFFTIIHCVPGGLYDYLCTLCGQYESYVLHIYHTYMQPVGIWPGVAKPFAICAYDWCHGNP